MEEVRCKTEDFSSCDLETDIDFSEELIGRMLDLTENQSLTYDEKTELAEDTSDRYRMESLGKPKRSLPQWRK